MKKTTEADMYPYTQVLLRGKYPKKDGWEIYPQDTRGKGTYIPDFVVERLYRTKIYKIPVEVKLECKATQDHIDQLNRYAKGLAGPNVKILSKILVYPAGADVSLVPKDMKIIKLTTFKCE